MGEVYPGGSCKAQVQFLSLLGVIFLKIPSLDSDSDHASLSLQFFSKNNKEEEEEEEEAEKTLGPRLSFGG
jgi:hypothetical protein